ncbi:MAG: hypothetical protein IT196_23870 [Acidimicrobiales bacterium]|nr:hypothetical protein [Acidimicrobiales bacterium]
MTSDLRDPADPTAGLQRGTPEWADALVASVLAGWGEAHELVECDPALADTAAFCEHYGYEPADSANTIIVATKEDPPRYAACVVLATHRLDVNKAVRKRFGARKVSFADPEQTKALTGMLIGGVTAVGLPDDLPLWVDAAVMGRERVILGGGSRNTKIIAAPALLRRVPGCEVVEGLAVEASPAAPVAPAAKADS